MMTFRKSLAVVCILNMLGGYAQAAAPQPSDFTQAQNQINVDSALVSQWMSDQLKFAIPFNATSGNVVPKQLKIFGIGKGLEYADQFYQLLK